MGFGLGWEGALVQRQTAPPNEGFVENLNQMNNNTVALKDFTRAGAFSRSLVLFSN